MDRIIAYCGLVCDECPAYQATQADDNEARARIAAEWSEAFGADMKVENINCDGCLGEGGRKLGYCSICEIRACAIERSVENCAHCSDYACEPLKGFLKGAPAAQALLDGMREAQQG